ncbi:MAG TPA: CBS domain-containing protein, partial [Gemmataceae bacterium]|nr:CBS domain-containing protein [Gemmataceae bacterium]
MPTTAPANVPTRLTLRAATAAELMSANPVSIHEGATPEEAIQLLTNRGYSAAPVIDEAGRPVGVLSRTDLLVHERERAAGGAAQAPAKVRDLMTPAVFSVAPHATSAQVVEQMCALNVHQ